MAVCVYLSMIAEIGNLSNFFFLVVELLHVCNSGGEHCEIWTVNPNMHINHSSERIR